MYIWNLLDTLKQQMVLGKLNFNADISNTWCGRNQCHRVPNNVKKYCFSLRKGWQLSRNASRACFQPLPSVIWLCSLETFWGRCVLILLLSGIFVESAFWRFKGPQAFQNLKIKSAKKYCLGSVYLTRLIKPYEAADKQTFKVHLG